MDVSELQLIGTALFVVAFCVFGAPILYRAIQRQWSEARTEDAWWRKAREELAGSVEIVGIDTRLIRPWGETTALERFIMNARAHGHGWLEPAVSTLQRAVPFAIRALATEIEGTKVAFIASRMRDGETIVKRLALGPNGVLEESLDDPFSPDWGISLDLQAIAERAKAPLGG